MDYYEKQEATCIYNLQQLMAHSKPNSFINKLISDYVPNRQYSYTDVTTINYTGGTAPLELKTRDERNIPYIEQDGIFVEPDKVQHGAKIFMNFLGDWKYVTIHFLPCIPIQNLEIVNVSCYNSGKTEPKYKLPLSWGYVFKYDGNEYHMTKPTEVFPCDRLTPVEYDADAWAESRKERLEILRQYNKDIVIN